MTVELYLGVGAVLWVLGLQGMMLLSSVLRRIIAINLMGSGVFLIMVALASRNSPADPVLQALVVTGLVVAVSSTAFALRLQGASVRRKAAGRAANGPGPRNSGGERGETEGEQG